jgi:predicted ATP-grasp superfamily ATP-dependent carboligase
MRRLPVPDLVILGASARAAAFSALRAGLHPACADLFADADLLHHCPCACVPPGDYPGGFVSILEKAPTVPWFYTGALENRPRLIHRLAGLRPLWGNDGPALRRVRSPFAVEKWLRSQKVPCPRHCRLQQPPVEGRWLLKPLRGAGGRGIRWAADRPTTAAGTAYWQEFIEGEPCAAIYVGAGRHAVLLGVTRQLVGESWLHAAAFHYCGSVGPLTVAPDTQRAFERLGQALVDGFALRGLFGVDCIFQGGVPYPVEVNPRYTASVEVLEYATGVPALALHREACTAGSIASPPHQPTRKHIGKAILFAHAPVVMPDSGPWSRALHRDASVHETPAFADVPGTGVPIEPGQPILTLFAEADSIAACADQLQALAKDLDRWLRRR